MLGTISNVEEAVMWLSYTYLFVRMRINPHVYGISLEEVEVNKQHYVVDYKKFKILWYF